MSQLDNNQVSAVRKRVMKAVLGPRGFTERGTSYFWLKQNQVWAVDFQAGQHGGKFFVNTAFHFDFVPSCFSLQQFTPAECTLLDCCLRSRLHLEADEYESQFPYPSTVDDCSALFERLAVEILSEFETYSALFDGPRYFVDLLTPSTLTNCRDWLCGTVEDGAAFDGSVDALLLAMNWFPDDYSSFLFLSYCALELGAMAEAQEYARLGIAAYDDYQPSRPKSTPYKKIIPITRINGRLLLDQPLVIQSRERLVAAFEYVENSD
jgi:hypothetical protein